MNQRRMLLFNNQKYRTILVSVALFLTFDVGVLIPNFLISKELQEYAVMINLSGRQRMLSQRIVKTLLQIERDQQRNLDISKSQKELAKVYNLFDETLSGFSKGQIVTGGDGTKVFLQAVNTNKTKKLVQEAQTIWNPYKQYLTELLKNTSSKEQLKITIDYALSHNLKILDYMNQLTTELEKDSNNLAFTLQQIQTLGFIFAISNFFIILFHTLTKLERGDQELEKAHREITELNNQLKAENIRMGAELEVTRKLQKMILPKEDELNQIPDLDICGYMEPANEVGGDYYDVLQYSSDHIKIGIGDVTGHGLESSVLMIMVQTAVRTLLEYKETNYEKFLDVLNRTIYHNVQRISSDKNLTLSLLDYRDGELYLSGQHEEMIVIRSQTQEVERIDTFDLGFPLGLEPEIRPFLNQKKIKLAPGEIVVLYTDGITEAENSDRQLYGIERLCEMVQLNSDLTAQEICRAVIEDVKLHIGQHTVYDDITLLVVKRKVTNG